MLKTYDVGFEFEVKNDHCTNDSKICIREFHIRASDMYGAMVRAYSKINNYLNETYDNAYLVCLSVEEENYYGN